ncbi:peptidase S8/S53 domain-containing protein [Xylariales sp. PMI_506]|nr:peptidase S8/S53 domain-containing protein [Xylariales sp. PMI_506]
MAPLTINANVWDPQEGRAVEAAADATDSNYIILQGNHEESFSEDHKKELRDVGVEFHEYMGNNTYLCCYKSTDLEVLRRKGYLSHVGVYPNWVKVQPGLVDVSQSGRTPSQFALRTSGSHQLGEEPDAGSTSSASASVPPAAADGAVKVTVALHRNSTRTPREIAGDLIERGIITADDTRSFEQFFHTTVDPKNLAHIASLDPVRAISPYTEEEDLLNIATMVLNLPEPLMELKAGGGTGTLVDCQGEGEIIHIADTGFDTGNASSLQDAFKGRCIEMFALSQTARIENPTEENLKDTDGHGTHVAGCAFGDGPQSVMLGPGGLIPGGRISGPAPKARYVITNLKGDPSGNRYDGDRREIFERAYDRGARVSNQSFGYNAKNAKTPPSENQYGILNENVDSYLKDKWDLVALYAAGNSGFGSPYPTQIGGPACSKNIITVGSTYSPRRVANKKYDENGIEMDPYVIAAHSSRGPCTVSENPLQTRQKPDVCAPGAIILSALSKEATGNDLLGVSADIGYMFRFGTSMATPQVAACAALIRQTLKIRLTPDPSAALVKALLINGAIDIERRPGDPSQIPNGSQGFGLVSVSASIKMVEAQTGDDKGKWGGFVDAKTSGSGTPQESPMKPFAQKGVQRFKIDIPAPKKLYPRGTETIPYTLKATLVWADAGGIALQNQLGLSVTWNPPQGSALPSQRRHGNKGTVDQSATPTEFDKTNNVQQVLWENIPEGVATVGVQCMTSGVTVDFAIAWSLE